MTSKFEEFFSMMGIPLLKEETQFNGDQLDKNREVVLIAMYMMHVNR